MNIAFYSFSFMLALVTQASKTYDKVAFKISIFYSDDIDDANQYIVDAFNVINKRIVKKPYQLNFTAYKVGSTDSFHALNKICADFLDGRILIIGIGNSPTIDHIRAASNSLDVPFIRINWNSYEYEYRRLKYDTENLKSELNMHPSNIRICDAIIDLVFYYNWEHITVLYEETIGMDRIHHLMNIPRLKSFNSDKYRIDVRQLGSNLSTWIFLLKDIKLKGSSHIIVDIQSRNLKYFIQQASEVGLMTSYFHYMFTTLDLNLLEYAPAANITAFQLYRPEDPEVKNVLNDWNTELKFLPSNAALIYDTLQLVLNTIEHDRLEKSLYSMPPKVSCLKEEKWAFGPSFKTYLKVANFTGITGEVSFDHDTGFRSSPVLYIVDMSKKGVELLGYWTREKLENRSIHILRSFSREYHQILDRLDRHLIVTTRLEDPYVMRKKIAPGVVLSDNERYEGYCIDLLRRIAKMCGFNYTIKLVEDGLYGTEVDGKWNGLVKELIDKKADIAVGAMSITYQRDQAIDFTKPFLNLGISILYKRPQKKTPNLFSFLSPLSIDIWLYMIAAYLVVSFMLFVLARFSPYEWQNPHPCNQESGIMENQFTLLNSLWFTIGSLMQQGTDLNPKSPSTRLISCVWAFFTLILISSYTANLAAFLTVQRLQNPIDNADDLSRQTEIKYGSLKGIDINPRSIGGRLVSGVWWFFALIMIASYTANLAAFQTTKRLTTPIEDVEALSKQTDIKYGCLIGGSTQQFFKESKIQTYERMWNFMNTNPDVFVNSTDAGLKRVKEGNYAFLIESTMNEYARNRDCELMQVGGLIDSKGYGIGTPTGSPWRDQISNAILKLQEDGSLQNLYSKWWKQNGALNCDVVDDKKKDSANELGLANVGGVFVVLVVGLCLSVIVAILEFIWKARQQVDSDDEPLKTQIMRDCKFALCSHKRVRRNTLRDITNQADNMIKIIPKSSISKSTDSTPHNIPKSKSNSLSRRTPQLQHKYLKSYSQDGIFTRGSNNYKKHSRENSYELQPMHRKSKENFEIFQV